jgi:hypothetical protein
LSAAGCGLQGVKEHSVPVSKKEPVGIEMAKQLLEGYAKGQPVGSEFMRFATIGEDAKKQDPSKGEIVDRGLKEIEGLMNKPSAIPNKAKEILAQLN